MKKIKQLLPSAMEPDILSEIGCSLLADRPVVCLYLLMLV